MPTMTSLHDQLVAAQAVADECARELAEVQRIAHVGSWSMDLATQQVRWSDEVYRIYGLEPQSEQVTAEAWQEFVHPDDRVMVMSNVQRIAAGGLHRDFTYRIVRRDGSVRHCYARPEALRDDENRIVALRGVVQDVTDLLRAERRIHDFVAVASHELRTPLTSISGFAATLDDRWGTLDERDKRSFVDIIATQAERLARLVDDLLTLARIDGTSFAALGETCDVGEVAGLVVRGLGVPVRVDGGHGVLLAVSADHLQQILVNYVANAVKYGAAPFCVDVEADAHWVTITVSDHGPGVAPAFVPELFERFTRDDGNEQGGTGLGLSIVAGIAGTYGGSAWYEPGVPRGARFVVQLPRGGVAAAGDVTGGS